MNPYIESQIINMKAIVKTFEASCRMAAMKNDGKTDSYEEKQLKKISTACAKFMKELDNIK